MPDLELDLEKIGATLDLAVLHKPGAVRLDGYPLLAHAPAQWGPGVRTEDVGASVAEIAVAAAESPDHDALAARFGTTPAHIAEAVRYALAAQPGKEAP
jgi:hypothetical protein